MLLRNGVDDDLALRMTYIQRRLRGISKESDDLREQLHAAEATAQEPTAITPELQHDLPDYDPQDD